VVSEHLIPGVSPRFQFVLRDPRDRLEGRAVPLQQLFVAEGHHVLGHLPLSTPREGRRSRGCAGLPSGCVVIDEDQLLDAVRVVNGAGRPVHAENVRKYLGEFADEGGYFEVGVVAADLEELESLGKLNRAPANEWNDSGPTPTTRIRYVLPSEQ
jgi:hypothetical protein